MVDERKKFFEEIMEILDDAEGTRDTTFGPFSFLWENSYVRDAVVSSFDTTTSITGLKLYLATNVLEMHSKGNTSRISYDQLRALINAQSSKKYSINYNALDECIDINLNKKAVREKMYSMFSVEDIRESLEYLEKTDILIPYLFMDKLRSAVWSRLRDFFKLCEQSVCSECTKKSMVYFQFIQSVALYEVFYIGLVQEQAADCMEKASGVLTQTKEEEDKLSELTKELNILEIQKRVEKLNDSLNDKVFENLYQIDIYQLLVVEFGISLNAMCYLLMIFEAMQVCNYEMRGLKHMSLKIAEKLRDIYDKELAMLVKSNHKRATRYRAVNKRIEELLQNQYPECEEFDEADVIHTFMLELCKPVKMRNKEVFRGLEVMLGYPIYKERRKES